MEEHNFKLIPILRYFSVILLFLAATAQSASNIYSAIYYGDADVDVGEPFSITCIISISDPIQWLKDGTPINIQSNQRHVKDYVFIESDSDIEGYDNKIEATISVKRAQPSHGGRYQCNSMHSNYHTLRVNKNHKSMAPGTSHHNKALAGHNNTNDLLTDSMDSDQSLFHTTTNLHHHHQHHTVHHQSTNLKHHLNKATDDTTKNDNNLSEFPPYPLPSPTDSYSNINQAEHDLDKFNAFAKFNDNDGGVTDRSYSANVNADGGDDVFHGTTVLSEDDDYIKINDKNASINLDNLFDISKKSVSANDSIDLANTRLLTVDELAILNSDDKSFSHEDLLKKDFRNDDVQTKTDAEEDECMECVISGIVGGRNISHKYENYDNKETDTITDDSELHIQMGNSETTSNSLKNNINGDIREMDNDISSTTTAKATTGAADLIPNYDNVEHKLKVFDETKSKPLLLSCNITTPGGPHTLRWYRNNKDVSLDETLTGRYDVIDKENSFIISSPREEDAGTFKCKLETTGEEREFIVAAKMYFKQINHNQAFVEGEKLKLHCIAYGTNPEIRWVITENGSSEVYNATRDRVRLGEDERNIKNAYLFIDDVIKDDRKNYSCVGTNIAIRLGNANYSEAEEYIFVRVKDKLAALWPFLGIVAEVVVLCVIILIYEKRRNKAELDESDTDQSPEQKNDHRGKDSEIRQRK